MADQDCKNYIATPPLQFANPSDWFLYTCILHAILITTCFGKSENNRKMDFIFEGITPKPVVAFGRNDICEE